MAQTIAWNSAGRSSLEVPVGLCLCLYSSGAHFCLCLRCSLTEFRISWQVLSSISSSQGLLLGDICSWYMSLYTPLISSLVAQGQQALWQIAPSPSVTQARAAAAPADGSTCSFLQWLQCARTSCKEGRGRGICEVPIMSWIFIQEDISIESLFASCIDMPSLCAVFAIWLSYLKLSSAW